MWYFHDSFVSKSSRNAEGNIPGVKCSRPVLYTKLEETLAKRLPSTVCILVSIRHLIANGFNKILPENNVI